MFLDSYRAIGRAYGVTDPPQADFCRHDTDEIFINSLDTLQLAAGRFILLAPLKNRTVMKACTTVVLCLFLMVLTGCATGKSITYTAPLTIYPDFLERKQNISKVALIADIIIAYDTSEDIDKVDVIKGKEVYEMLLKIFVSGLNQKGYLVEKTVLSSMGLYWDPNLIRRVVRTTEDSNLDLGVLPIGNPPFYINEAFVQNDEMKQILSYIYRICDTYVKGNGDPYKAFSEATVLGTECGCDALFVIVIGCRKVPFGKQFGQGMATGILTGIMTLGTVGIMVSEASTSFIGVFIIDCKDGKVIWADRRFEKEFSGRLVRLIAKSIVEEIPAK